MAGINTYADDPTTTDSDRFLTYAADGTTKLTPASNVNKYLGPGWTIAIDSWTYSSYNSTTLVGVINANSGANTRYSAGMWFMFTQPTLGVKYAKVISATSTTVTVLLTNGLVLSNEAITSPFYSTAKAPLSSGGKISPNEIDFASTTTLGGGGIWWEELGRNTLTSAGPNLSVPVIAQKKYLHIIAVMAQGGSNPIPNLRFNNDSSSNYSLRASDNGASDGVFTTQNSITLFTGIDGIAISTIDVVNVASFEKPVIGHTTNTGGASAAGQTGRRETQSKWANTTNAITRVDIVGSSNFAAGSELIVLGHD